MPEISIVIPCRNEAGSIGSCVEEAGRFLRNAGLSGEIIVVDNGCSDRSAEVARAAGARIVAEPRPGYGRALNAGIAEARGIFTAMGDGDGSYDFTELSPFLDALRNGADLVMGNRFRGSIEDGAMPRLHRYIGNPFFSKLTEVCFNTGVADVCCGLRAFRTKRIQELQLKSNGMEFAVEMVIRAAVDGYRTAEFPIKLRRDRREGRSHLRTWRDGFRTLALIIQQKAFQQSRRTAKSSRRQGRRFTGWSRSHGRTGSIIASLVAPLHCRLVGNRRVIKLSSWLARVLPRAQLFRGIDVGCGSGEIARALMERRPDLLVSGAEVVEREGAALESTIFDGSHLPYPDDSFDFTLLVDVLHHTTTPESLLKECARISSRYILVKDHYCQTGYDLVRLSLMDWFGNAVVPVPLPCHYLSRAEWAAIWQALNLRVVECHDRLELYPSPFSRLFDAGLHFIALLEVRRAGA